MLHSLEAFQLLTVVSTLKFHIKVAGKKSTTVVERKYKLKV